MYEREALPVEKLEALLLTWERAEGDELAELRASCRH